MGKIRLDRFLSNEGGKTRTEAKKYIKAGAVTVNGEVIRQPEFKADPEADQICLEGTEIRPAGDAYYLFHKPAGCVTATEDDYSKTVMDYLDVPKKDWLFPVGRLDKDTEGLLLITDDGALAHSLLSPRKHVDKTYYAEVSGEVTEEDCRAFQEGLDIGDEKDTLPALLKVLDTHKEAESTVSKVEVTIREGRYHQIKRMFQAVGKEVLYLKRLSMGSLKLPEDLEKGCWRLLTPKEIEELKKCV